METYDLPAALEELESKEEALVAHDRVKDAPEWFIIAMIVCNVRMN